MSLRFLSLRVLSLAVLLSLELLQKSAATTCADCDGMNVSCVDGKCLPRCVNVISSGDCLQCRNTFVLSRGQCLSCSQHCLNNICELKDLRIFCTEGCVTGKKGDNCEANCSNSCNGCERFGDECLGPCRNKNFYGKFCSKPCPIDCKGFCDQDGSCINCKSGCKEGVCRNNSEECDSCISGHTGRYCNMTCHKACTECDQNTQICTACRGDMAFGPFCSKACSANCSGCYKDTGECKKCRGGKHHGPFCSEACPQNCEKCKKESGECEVCESGHRREFCDDPCLPCDGDKCLRTACRPRDKVFAELPPKSDIYVIAIPGAVFIVGISAFVAVFIALRYWRKKRRRRHRNSTPSVHYLSPPDTGSSDQYWTHKYWDIEEENLDRHSSINADQSTSAQCPSSLDQRDALSRPAHRPPEVVPASCARDPKPYVNAVSAPSPNRHTEKKEHSDDKSRN